MVLVIIEQYQILHSHCMGNIYKSCMTAVLIKENFQSTLPDFLKWFFTAGSVYISAIEYLTLKGGVLIIQKAVSIDC